MKRGANDWQSCQLSALADMSSKSITSPQVLVIEGAGEAEEASDEAVLAALQAELAGGQPPSAAARSVAAALGVSRRRAYALALQLGAAAQAAESGERTEPI